MAKKPDMTKDKFEQVADKTLARMLRLQDKDLERKEFVRVLKQMYALGRRHGKRGLVG